MSDLWLPGASRRDQGGSSILDDDVNEGAYVTHHITWDKLLDNGALPRFASVAGYLEQVEFEPHLMIDPFGGRAPIQWFAADKGARALRDVAGAHKPNRYGRVNIQIEWWFSPGVVVDGKKYDTLADTPMAFLPEVMAWLRSLGVPDRWAIAAPKWSGNKRAWPTGGGHLGHCHWPENTHTDPGPMGDIFARVPAPHPKPPADPHAADRARLAKIPKSMPHGLHPDGTKPSAKPLQELLSLAGYRVDGRSAHYGPETQHAVVDFHHDHPQYKSDGVASDPAIGPDGWHALLDIAAHRLGGKS